MTWKQTASGRAFDLLHPRAEDVDFARDVAWPLACLARYGGHVPAGVYSVAQHCVQGADALLEETGSPAAALAFLLHDAHEAYCGDIATPVAKALATHAGLTVASPQARDSSGRRDPHQRAAEAAVTYGLKRMKRALDAAIHAAAGVPWPLPAMVEHVVEEMDRRMLNTERAQFLAPPPRPWPHDDKPTVPVRLRGRLRCWPAENACAAWLDRLHRWAPACRPQD
jgi:uncharacterized protein